MSAFLDPHASAAAEALSAFERALAQASSQWNDSVRSGFDQRYAEPLIASGRRAVTELYELSHDLTSAVRDLDQV